MRLIVVTISILILSLGYTKSSGQNAVSLQQATETPFINEPQLQSKNTVELFPNPVEDFLQIKILNSELQNVRFEMHSIIGNVVQIESEEVGHDAYRIPVESFASGYYFLIVKDDATRFSKAFKFLKKD